MEISNELRLFEDHDVVGVQIRRGVSGMLRRPYQRAQFVGLLLSVPLSLVAREHPLVS